MGFSDWIVYAFGLGTAGFVTFAVWLYNYQDNLLYFPTQPSGSKDPDQNPKGFRSPAELDLPFEDVYVITKDGVRVHGWLIKREDSRHRPTLLYFHGNAGNIGFRLHNASQMYRSLSCNIFLVDYRGYGKSDGKPSEEGLIIDAEAFIRVLHDRPDLGIDPSKIVLFGRSLGGAVAIAAAERCPEDVAGLILENKFLSISHMVDELMPWLKRLKPYVLKIKWDSADRARRLCHPVLLVSGGRDELVPSWHMTRLRQILGAACDSNNGKHKVSWHLVPDGQHNDTWMKGGEEYYKALAKFLASIGVLSSETCAKPPPPGLEKEGLGGAGTSIPIMPTNALF